MFEQVFNDKDSFLISLKISHLDSVQSVLKINMFEVLHIWISHPALGHFAGFLHFKEAFFSSRSRESWTNKNALYLDAENRW